MERTRGGTGLDKFMSFMQTWMKKSQQLHKGKLCQLHSSPAVVNLGGYKRYGEVGDHTGSCVGTKLKIPDVSIPLDFTFKAEKA
jgi:hypothetical protein